MMCTLGREYIDKKTLDEIERLSKMLTNRNKELLKIDDESKEKDKEIAKLNNIINELEKILEEERKKGRSRDDYNYGVGNTFDYIWYKLQELKAGDKE